MASNPRVTNSHKLVPNPNPGGLESDGSRAVGGSQDAAPQSSIFALQAKPVSATALNPLVQPLRAREGGRAASSEASSDGLNSSQPSPEPEGTPFASLAGGLAAPAFGTVLAPVMPSPAGGSSGGGGGGGIHDLMASASAYSFGAEMDSSATSASAKRQRTHHACKACIGSNTKCELVAEESAATNGTTSGCRQCVRLGLICVPDAGGRAAGGGAAGETGGDAPASEWDSDDD